MNGDRNVTIMTMLGSLVKNQRALKFPRQNKTARMCKMETL